MTIYLKIPHTDPTILSDFPAGEYEIVKEYPNGYYITNGTRKIKFAKHRFLRSIDEDTVLLPTLIAEGVVTPGPEAEEAVKYLTERAEKLYHHSDQFREAITQGGNKGRDALYAFMRHWLEGYLRFKNLKYNNNG